MTTFDKREEGFEKKFAVDENLKFKSIARRNRLFGQWVAEKLGKSGDERDAYAKEVVAAEIDGGEAAVASRSPPTLPPRAARSPEADIKAKLDEFLAVAVAQVKAGT